MKIFVLGASGMLGSRLLEALYKVNFIDVYAVIRDKSELENNIANLLNNKVIRLNGERFLEELEKEIILLRPNIIINCIGIVKQSVLAFNYIESLSVNALLPHKLVNLGTIDGFKLIHISTDCVFNGEKGGYVESDLSDAEDLYGRSKYLGEVNYGNSLTLRTSIIGHELSTNKHGLVDWFLSQEGIVNGYKNAFFSGFTTNELAKIIIMLISNFPEMRGLYNLASTPISKFELLKIISDTYSSNTEIIPCDYPEIDRTLNGSLFNNLTSYIAPSWQEQILEMFKDRNPDMNQ